MGDFPERRKLIEYLPPFMQSFGELQEIMRVEDKWMDKLQAGIEKIYDNAFIEDCDEYGIRKYESMLGILPGPQDKLEVRRRRVLAEWNTVMPYTYGTMLRQLNVLCGVNNYDIDSDLENYRISISIYERDDVSEIERVLDRILPQNIWYEVRAAESSMGRAATGAVWQDDEIITIRQVVL